MKSFLFAAFLLIAGIMQSQPVTKAYAFSQSFTPGIVPQREMPGEDGTIGTRKSYVTVVHYIYILLKPASSVKVTKVWIKGQWYAISDTALLKAPVLSEQPAVKTLVPATKQTVIQIEPGDSLPPAKKMFPSLAKMTKESELVIVYTWKNRTWYLPVKKFTILDPVHGI